MDTEKVHLTRNQETLLAPLYGRALESRSQNPILHDEMAENAIDRIDYDFSRFKIGKSEAVSVAIRTKQFDAWTSEYIAEHPDVLVLHLGCGLDTRVFRVNPPSTVTWYDVDLPEIIDLRRQLFPERPGYNLLAASLADLQWLDPLPRDCPVWIVAENVTMYLSARTMSALLNRLTTRFPKGGIAFDAVSSSVAKMGGANLGGFFIDDPEEIRKVAPRLKLIHEARIPELPGYSKLPWTTRLIQRMMDRSVRLRRTNGLLLYQFQ